MSANRYIERIVANEFTCCWKRITTMGPDEPAWKGSHYVVMAWRSRDARWRLLTHFFVMPDGSIGASGLMDPKCLHDFSDGVDYFVPDTA